MADFDFVTAAFFAMMTSGYSPMDNPNGFSDSFVNASGIDWDISHNVLYEPARTLVHGNRQLGRTVLYEPFDRLDGWSSIKTGTARVRVVKSSETDAAVGKYTLEMRTGKRVGSVAGLKRYVGKIPSSFGIMFIPDLVRVGSDRDDALEITITNDDKKLLRLQLVHGDLQVLLSGEWQSLSKHVKAYPKLHGPEWWVEVVRLDSGEYKIAAYTGTQQRGAHIGLLPESTTLDKENLNILQKSGATADRTSKLAILEIGDTQRAQDMELVSVARNSRFSPSHACIATAIEDVSVALMPNVNLKARLSRDNGRTWALVDLEDAGEYGWGELGTKKKIHLLHGCVDFKDGGTGQKIRYKLQTKGGDFFAIQNVTYFWRE